MINESNIENIFEYIDEIADKIMEADKLREMVERIVYDLRAMQVEIDRLGGVIENLQAKAIEDNEEYLSLSREKTPASSRQAKREMNRFLAYTP